MPVITRSSTHDVIHSKSSLKHGSANRGTQPLPLPRAATWKNSDLRIPIPKSRISARIAKMPPRYAYWTILIDSTPTAFRAREKEELLPTFHQLRRTNKDVVMKWFARGRLWQTPEEASAAQRKKVVPERRGQEWRPGGAHKDPRDRFKKGAKPSGVAQVFRPAHKPPGGDRAFRLRPASPDRRSPAEAVRPAHKPRERRLWTNKPGSGTGASQPRGDAPRH